MEYKCNKFTLFRRVNVHVRFFYLIPVQMFYLNVFVLTKNFVEKQNYFIVVYLCILL